MDREQGAFNEPPLEREKELRLLGDALSVASEGRGRVVLVEASPGAGKTTLIKHACRMASDQGFRVLAARGAERERDLPFGLVRQLLEPLVGGYGEAKTSGWLAGAAANATVVLGQDAAEAPASEVFAVVHGLYWLIANLAADAPLVLAVDDAQWADDASLRFLAYLQHRIGGLPVVLEIATRPPDRADSPELQAIRSAPEGVRLEPRELTFAGAGALIERVLAAPPDPAFVAACLESTGGNPFYLMSLLSLLRERDTAPDADHAAVAAALAPDEVRRSVLDRLARLGSEAHALARSVAVFGAEVPLYRAARHAGLDPAAAERVADRLSASGLLRAGRPLEFEHPVLREAVYLDLGAGERSQAHRRAARLLADEGCPPEEISSQLVLADPVDDPEAVVLLRAAASASIARGAPESAVRYLTRALGEPAGQQRRDVLLELGRAETLLARREGTEHLREALQISESPQQRAEVAVGLLNAEMMWGGASAVSLVEPFTAALADEDPDLALRLDAELMITAGTEFADVGAIAARLASRLDTPGSTAAGRIASAVRGALAQDAEAAGSAAEGALGEGLLVEETTSASLLPFTVCWTLVLADRLDQAQELVDAATASARVQMIVPGIGMASLWQSLIMHRRGDLEAAAEEATFGLGLNLELGTSFGIPWHRAALVAALTDRGRLAEADAALGHLAEGPVEIANTGDLLLTFHRGRLRRAEGRHQDALAHFEEVSDHAGSSPRSTAWLPHHGEAARSLLAVGDQAGATRLAETELELARRWGTNRAIGKALHILALASPKGGRASLLEEAAGYLGSSAARLEHAEVLLDLGAERRRLGERASAREILRDAEERAAACGAAALVARARDELAAAGARSRKVVRSGVDALTPSEMRVARLAAAGRTNPEIAQELFVTAKTVETHLRHVYQKLGLASRRELATALDQPR